MGSAFNYLKATIKEEADMFRVVKRVKLGRWVDKFLFN